MADAGLSPAEGPTSVAPLPAAAAAAPGNDAPGGDAPALEAEASARTHHILMELADLGLPGEPPTGSTRASSRPQTSSRTRPPPVRPSSSPYLSTSATNPPGGPPKRDSIRDAGVLAARFSSLSLSAKQPNRRSLGPAAAADVGGSPDRRVTSADGVGPPPAAVPRKSAGQPARPSETNAAGWDSKFWQAGTLTFGRDEGMTFGPAHWLRSDDPRPSDASPSPAASAPIKEDGAKREARLSSPPRPASPSQVQGGAARASPARKSAAAADAATDAVGEAGVGGRAAAWAAAAALAEQEALDSQATEIELRCILADLRRQYGRLEAKEKLTRSDKDRECRKLKKMLETSMAEKDVYVLELGEIKAKLLNGGQAATQVRVELEHVRSLLRASQRKAASIEEERSRQHDGRLKAEAAALAATREAADARAVMEDALHKWEAEMITVRDHKGNIVSQAASAREEAVRLAKLLEEETTARVSEREKLSRRVHVLEETAAMKDKLLSISKQTAAEKEAELVRGLDDVRSKFMAQAVRLQLSEASREQALAVAAVRFREEIARLQEALNTELTREKPSQDEVLRRMEVELRSEAAASREDARQLSLLNEALRLENRGLTETIELYKVEPLAATLGKKGYTKAMSDIKIAVDEQERQRVAKERRDRDEALEAQRKTFENSFAGRLQAALRETFDAAAARERALLDRAEAAEGRAEVCEASVRATLALVAAADKATADAQAAANADADAAADAVASEARESEDAGGGGDVGDAAGGDASTAEHGGTETLNATRTAAMVAPPAVDCDALRAAMAPATELLLLGASPSAAGESSPGARATEGGAGLDKPRPGSASSLAAGVTPQPPKPRRAITPSLSNLRAAGGEGLTEYEMRVKELEGALRAQLESARADAAACRADLAVARGEVAAARFQLEEIEIAASTERREQQLAAIERQSAAALGPLAQAETRRRRAPSMATITAGNSQQGNSGSGTNFA